MRIDTDVFISEDGFADNEVQWKWDGIFLMSVI